jgi:hypothetical protein
MLPKVFNCSESSFHFSCALLLCCQTSKRKGELRIDSNHVETGNPFVLYLRIASCAGQTRLAEF